MKIPPNTVDGAFNAPLPEYDGTEETVEDVLAKRPKYGGRKPGSPNKNKKFEMTKQAQLYSLRAFATVLEIMEDPDESGAVRLACAKEVLDRGFGKSKQAVEISGVDGEDIQHRLVVEFVGQLPTTNIQHNHPNSFVVNAGSKLPQSIEPTNHLAALDAETASLSSPAALARSGPAQPAVTEQQARISQAQADATFNPSKQMDQVIEQVVLPNFKKPWE